MGDDRLSTVNTNLKLLREQLAGLENAKILAPLEEKTRIQQQIDQINSEIRRYEAEKQELQGSQAITTPPPDRPDPGHPIALESPLGTMRPDSPFCVERSGDAALLRALTQTDQRQGLGATLSITGSRQVGKSSLVVRGLVAAEKVGKATVLVDFQQCDRAILGNEDDFYRWFCGQLAQELVLEDNLETHWQKYRKGGNNSCCTQYLKRQILTQVSQPLVIALDEVEMLLDSPFRSQFFGLVRSWHNRRALDPDLRRVDWVLVSSTEPNQLIADLNQSPFNVAENIEMKDFTLGQVKELNDRHGLPFSLMEEPKLYDLTGGHPFLVRQALYWVATGQQTAGELLATATEEKGAFGEHLRHHRSRLDQRPELGLKEGMKLVVQGKGDRVEKSVVLRLEAAGLVRSHNREAEPRCELYRLYFQEVLR